MDRDELSRLLGGWEGYALGTIGRVAAGTAGRARGEIWIELHPKPDHPRRCSGCGDAERMLLDWLGHADSSMLAIYYHQREADAADSIRNVKFVVNARSDVASPNDEKRRT